MVKAHKIRIYPTVKQEILLRKSCGIARFSYNWALSKWKELYEAGERPNAYMLVKLQNSIKREQMPFFLEVSKNAPQYAIHNLENAFNKFFTGKANYPRFKKKGKKDCFVAIENQVSFKQENYKIRLPRIGFVKCAENLRFEGKVNNVVVKRIADRWFAVVNIEILESTPALKQDMGDNQAIVGVDLGIKSMVVLSDGTIFKNPMPLKKNLKRLKRKQRRLSRKQKGSKNRIKQKIKISRLFYRIANIRNNAIHQVTAKIIKQYDIVVIENLPISGMLKNEKLSKSISDVSFYEIRRQIEYKAKWHSKEVIIADRWFPSSKTCSSCGHKKEKLLLSERMYNCDNCGIYIDRDLNAAKNLANYGTTAKFAGSHAFGVGSSPAEMQDSPTMKKEVKINYKLGPKPMDM